MSYFKYLDFHNIKKVSLTMQLTVLVKEASWVECLIGFGMATNTQ